MIKALDKYIDKCYIKYITKQKGLTMTSENNRVWIEIENPKHDDHKTGHERAEKMSALLKKLNPKWGKNFNPIFWHENKNRYCYQSCPGDGFLTLENSGHWFNLDYLSK